MSVRAGLVSTIIPVHNRATMIVEAVASVLEQDYRPVEAIVVDDGSDDATPDVLRSMQREHAELRVLTLSRHGPGMARQAGFEAAQGEYIQYLDSDDLLLAGKFSAQVAALTAHKDCDIAYGYTALQPGLDADIVWAPYKGTGQAREYLFPDLLADRWWSTSTALFRKRLLDRVGAWADLSNEEDWEYDSRVAALKPRLAFVPAFASVIRRHDCHQSHAGTTDPGKLAARAQARRSILQSAERAGIPPDAPHRKAFARYAFLLARQCGAVGLIAQADALCRLAIQADPARRSLDVRAYRLLSRLAGHKILGQLAQRRDHLRNRVGSLP